MGVGSERARAARARGPCAALTAAVRGSILANRLDITWRTKTGVHRPDYFGSVTQVRSGRPRVAAPRRCRERAFAPRRAPQASTVKLGGCGADDV